MTAASEKSHHVYLIDGSGFIFRAFHALPPMTRRDGTPVNAVFGFTNMLMKLIENVDADHIAVIFDYARESFRNEIYPDYKANRPETPPELVPQFEIIREATRAFNLPSVEMEGFEADDLIATYARQAAERGWQVTIASSDKDLMQLVSDRIEMADPIRNRKIGANEVKEKFGVGPDKMVDLQALAGDATDNVPGVPGIGVKTAAELINAYGDLDTILERAPEIKQPKRRQALIDHAEAARLSRRLVTLKDDVPVTDPLDSFAVRRPDPQALTAFLKAQGFKSILARVEGRLAAAGEIPPAGARQRRTGESPEAKEIAPAAGAYELVQDVGALERWIARASADGVVAVDTETTSLDTMRAELVGVSLSLAAGEACYIPLGHKAPAPPGQLQLSGPEAQDEAGRPEQIGLADALARLKPMLEDPGVLKVGQNIKYDMAVLARHGIHLAPVDDTMVMSYVLEGGLHDHGLDALAELHLGHTTIKYKDVTGTGKGQVGFDRVPLEKALDYAAEDADVTGRLHRLFKPRLVAEAMVTVYETIERPLIPVLVQMEAAGVKVDVAELRRLSQDFAKRLEALEAEIHGLAGHPFTIGSPKQLGEVLFEEMGLTSGRKGKSGAYSTGADVLDDLAAQGHELPARVLDWRQLAKLKTTYADALTSQINPESGRVHTSYSQAVTSTGRLSSTDPNLQNIPVRTEEGRKIRRAFVAEEGFRLVSLDYSQIELRLLAHVAQIKALREAFRAGEDIHALTASQVFGVPAEAMDAQIRRKAKAINFGIIYGISPFGLARQLGIAQGEAKAYIQAYFERYPGIRDYMEQTKASCRERGYVETPFGRRVHVPFINDKNPVRRGFAERQAINAPLQGGAADIIKRAMIRVPEALEAAGLKARMLLQVHDELLFEVPEAEVEETTQVVRGVMEGAALPAVELSVPLTVDVGVGQNWAEAH
jgi:DNA polymerase-1